MHADRESSFAYLPVPDTLVQLGLYVTGAGTEVVPPNSPYPPQQHPDLYHFSWARGRVLPEYQFVLILEGRGEFESVGMRAQDVQSGTVMVLFPDVWHRYRPQRKTGWTEYWISINGDLMFDWQQRGLIRPEQPLWPLNSTEDVVRQYQEVIESVTNDPLQGSTQNAARALMILASILDHRLPGDMGTSSAQVETQPDLDPVIAAAMHEIWNYSHRRISVATIADRLHVSRRTLERRFQQEVGHSVLQELLNCRMERACRLLRETSMPVKQIAFASGFGSMSSFCRLFQRELQISPTRYRTESHETVTEPQRRRRARADIR